MKNALQLTEEDFALPGRSAVQEAQELSSEIDAIWQRREIERKQRQLRIIPDNRKSFMTAAQAEMGKVYTICIEEDGRERYVKAEFLTRGRREFLNLVFFRRAVKGGKILIHGIQNYTLIKETYVEPPERD